MNAGPRTRSDSGKVFAWSQVVLASVLMVATLPGRTQGLGLVTEPMLAELELDRLAYANMNLAATLLGALFCVPAGWAIDRAGLRWFTVVVVVAFGAVVWRFSVVGTSALLLFLLLLGTRALGQSVLSVCSITTVGKWFGGRVGMAMGVYSVLLSLWFALAFVVVGYSVRENGWRIAWSQIAITLLFVVAPVVALVLREPPGRARSSRVVEAPDHSGANAEPHSSQSDRVEFSLTQAFRTGSFWVYAGAAAAFNLVSSGLGLFNQSVLAERGFDQATFHAFLAVSTLLSLGGQFICGWLTRRFEFRTLTMAALTLYAAGLALLPAVRHRWQLWLVAALLGIAGGMIIVIFFSVWSEMFGQRHLGRIQGAAQTITVLSSGIGPVLFAKSAALYGSYSPLLFALAGAVFALALIARSVRPPAV